MIEKKEKKEKNSMNYKFYSSFHNKKQLVVDITHFILRIGINKNINVL